MQENERQKSMLMQRFADNVGSPERQKQLHDEMMKQNSIQTSQSLQNERFYMAQMYQQRLRDEHKNMLQNQMKNDKEKK